MNKPNSASFLSNLHFRAASARGWWLAGAAVAAAQGAAVAQAAAVTAPGPPLLPLAPHPMAY
jgi:hypothetical protein